MGLSEKDNLLEGTGVGIEADSKQPVLVLGAASDEMTVKAKKDTKRILVVDDVESIVMTVKMLLYGSYRKVLDNQRKFVAKERKIERR